LPWRNKNPDSATVVTSASDQMMSEKQKKQQSVSVESPVTSTADGVVVLNTTFNTTETGLYCVHPQARILYPCEEMEDADKFPLHDDGVEHFC